MAATVFGYIVGVLVIKIINAIVISAMIDSCIKKQKGVDGDNKD
jgi:hypothetical protein